MLGTLTWYVTRASGVIAYALLAVGTLWGLVLSTRLTGKRPPRPWVLDVHRMLGGLAVALTGVHIVSILLDSFVHFDVVDVLVPFASSWNPAAVALGVVAFYLLAAVEVTSLLRQRLSNKTWRRVHYLSFVLFLMASAHFIAAGTDAASPLALGVILLAVGSVVALTAYRVIRHTQRARPPQPHEPQPKRVVTSGTFGAVAPPLRLRGDGETRRYRSERATASRRGHPHQAARELPDHADLPRRIDWRPPVLQRAGGTATRLQVRRDRRDGLADVERGVQPDR
jgi:DMSO/TMAO reductase YedYZ heme-binding membrane subunit